MTSNLDPRNWREWEIAPNTRDSVTLFTKRYPIDITLATADTAEALFTVAPGIPTVNLITNPSAETSDPPTGFSAVLSATLARDATYINYGTYSLKVTPPNAARGEGAYWNLGSFPARDPLAISAYFRRGAAGADDARVELFASTTPDSTISNIRVAVGNTLTLSGSWQRSMMLSPANRSVTIFRINAASGTFAEDETLTGGTSGATAVVNTYNASRQYIAVRNVSSTQFECQKHKYATETVTGGTSSETATLTAVENLILTTANLYAYFVTATQHGTVFYVDDCQAEIGDQVTTYCDGSRGIFYEWDGTAHASTSRRKKSLSCIRSMRLHATKDCLIAYDRDASNTASNAQDKGEFIRSGSDFGEDHPIYLSDKISFINATNGSGERPRIYGSIDGI